MHILCWKVDILRYNATCLCVFLQIQGGKLNEEIMVIVLKALKPQAGKDKEAEYREGIAECNEKSKCRYVSNVSYIHTCLHNKGYVLKWNIKQAIQQTRNETLQICVIKCL